MFGLILKNKYEFNKKYKRGFGKATYSNKLY